MSNGVTFVAVVFVAAIDAVAIFIDAEPGVSAVIIGITLTVAVDVDVALVTSAAAVSAAVAAFVVATAVAAFVTTVAAAAVVDVAVFVVDPDGNAPVQCTFIEG